MRLRFLLGGTIIALGAGAAHLALRNPATLPGLAQELRSEPRPGGLTEALQQVVTVRAQGAPPAPSASSIAAPQRPPAPVEASRDPRRIDEAIDRLELSDEERRMNEAFGGSAAARLLRQYYFVQAHGQFFADGKGLQARLEEELKARPEETFAAIRETLSRADDPGLARERLSLVRLASRIPELRQEANELASEERSRPSSGSGRNRGGDGGADEPRADAAIGPFPPVSEAPSLERSQ
jgi:hypothetical protein